MTAEERRRWAGEMSRDEGTSRHGAAESVGGGETEPHKVAAAEGDTHGCGLTLGSSLGRRVEANGGTTRAAAVMADLDADTTEPEPQPSASVRQSTQRRHQ